jgi:hypothetical protein
MSHAFTVTEEERQAVLLALAKLAIERPGWVYFLRGIAGKLDGVEMFDEFLRLEREDRP